MCNTLVSCIVPLLNVYYRYFLCKTVSFCIVFFVWCVIHIVRDIVCVIHCHAGTPSHKAWTPILRLFCPTSSRKGAQYCSIFTNIWWINFKSRAALWQCRPIQRLPMQQHHKIIKSDKHRVTSSALLQRGKYRHFLSEDNVSNEYLWWRHRYNSEPENKQKMGHSPVMQKLKERLLYRAVNIQKDILRDHSVLLPYKHAWMG